MPAALDGVYVLPGYTIIHRLCEDHDIEVLYWGNELLNERESTARLGLYPERS